jgi:hypothetical protein
MAGAGYPVFYTIAGATGIYSGDTGGGEAGVDLTPARGKGARHGKVTIIFQEGVILS